MINNKLDTVLELLKIDIGITHTARDEYFKNLIQALQKELKTRGVTLNLSEPDDQMLLADYCVWNYRHRNEDVPISKNLQLRIINRTAKKRGENSWQ